MVGEDPRKAEAKVSLVRMRDTLKGLGPDYDLKKAKKHLKGTIGIFKEGKYFEIPNREAVFETIIEVVKEKSQRAAVVEKIRTAREDIKHLEEEGEDVETLQDVFQEISEYMRDKEYEVARIKFLELDFQITKAKKALGEDVGENPLLNPKVKKVIISGDRSKDEEEDDDDIDEELMELEVLEEEDADKSSEAVDEGEEDDGLQWEDDDESDDSSDRQNGHGDDESSLDDDDDDEEELDFG